MTTDVRSARAVTKIIRGQPTSDGDGVRLTRIIGGHNLPDLDPFLLFDEFGSDSAADYIGGFPNHPHRGFETVTYMLVGRMRHRDNQGNSGLLVPGSVQWMTAGRGIVHSEMPEQEHGRMRGFQLWVNLPARDKMTEPRYQDIPPEQKGKVYRMVLDDMVVDRLIAKRSAEVKVNDADVQKEIERIKTNFPSEDEFNADRKSTRLNSSHPRLSRMPSSA